MEFDGLKQFFGEDGNTAITYEQLTKGINEKGIKLADLSLGGYIAKDKYDEQTRKYNELKNGASKYADYDDIKNELETLRTEKADRELIEKLSGKKVKPEFQKFVLSEIKGLVTEDKNFDKAMEEYLKENAQYLAVEDKNDSKVIFKGSSVKLDGSAGGGKNINQKMNDMFRNVRK